MKATMTFNLPEDAVDFRLAQMGPGLHALVFDLRERYLRQEVKRDDLSQDQVDVLNRVQEWLADALQNLEINFESAP